jgi:hypothetical protein
MVFHRHRLPLKALRLLPVVLVAVLVLGVATADGAPQSVLIPNAQYAFPYYAPGEGGFCTGPCSTGEVRLTADATGAQITKWAFTAYAKNASCRKANIWQGAKSSSREDIISIGPSGHLHYLARHSTKTQRLELTVNVLDGGKTLRGWFLIASRVHGHQCTTGRVKFAASTNEERE